MTEHLNHSALNYTVSQRLICWAIHLFTASGVIFGLFALKAVFEQQFVLALWLMAIAVFIDAVDGTLARGIDVKRITPEIDGALLDNIIDYLNYAVVPACFLIVGDFLPPGWKALAASIVLLSSAYQFCQSDAKTNDHFFKGFPSFWNITIFYIFLWQTSQWTNLLIVTILTVLTFVPIKYVYPSQLDNLTRNFWLRKAMGLATVAWGVATLGLLWIYPESNIFLLFISLAYVILYFGISVYRTFVPLES